MRNAKSLVNALSSLSRRIGVTFFSSVQYFVFSIDRLLNRFRLILARFVLREMKIEFGDTNTRIFQDLRATGLVGRQLRKESHDKIYEKWQSADSDFMNGFFYESERKKRECVEDIINLQGNSGNSKFPPLLSHSFSNSIGHLAVHYIHKQCRGAELDQGPRTIIKPAQVGNDMIFKYLTEGEVVVELGEYNATSILHLTPLIENLEIIRSTQGYIHLYKLIEMYAQRSTSESISRAKGNTSLESKYPQYVENSEMRLVKLGLLEKDNFVVLHVRSLERRRDVRNAEIADFDSAITRILDEGLKVVRIGTKESKSQELERPGFIDLAGLPESNDLFLHLLNRCHAFIGSNSGPGLMAQALGVPTLITNLTSIARNTFSFQSSLYLPKTILFQEKPVDLAGYFTPFVGFGEPTKRSLWKRGYEVRSNTQEEILRATDTFLDFIDSDNARSLISQQESVKNVRLNSGALTHGLLAPSFFESTICA